jgi:hypothetical protein
MYPISFALKLAISFFHIDVVVYDTQYVTDETTGQDVREISTIRVLRIALDPTRSKDIERIFGGSVGDGDIGLYCGTDTLYIDDAYGAGGHSKQSFVLYQGNYYRVVQDADWTPQGDVRVYLARRHYDQDGLFDAEESS